MKTKQNHIKAVFTTENQNAVNMSRDKETIARFLIIDKKTEKRVVDCQVYAGRSGSASKIYASIWVDLKQEKMPDGWQYGYASGHGSAGGYGYDKVSQAIEHAIESAGIALYGTLTVTRKTIPVDFKKRAYIGGTGCHEAALQAIAYACGYSDCIVIAA